MSHPSSPDGMALQSHYSLRWNNHQAHILQAFEALLHAELLVDVTLVCAETSLRAHKVVLSVCSPFFERIFAEHPCKHPVIVLKDFPGREIAALIDFMYRGEVRVEREDLAGLMHAAESLQIRGLASSEPRPASPPSTPCTLLDEPQTPERHNHHLHHHHHHNQTMMMNVDGPTTTTTPTTTTLIDEDEEMPPASTPIFARTHHHHHHHITAASAAAPHHLHHQHQQQQPTPMGFPPRDGCVSPLMPRRKQARPRRRSGELLAVPQDLSRPHPPPSLSPPSAGLNLSNSSQKDASSSLSSSHSRQQSQERSPSSHSSQQQQQQQQQPAQRLQDQHHQQQQQHHHHQQQQQRQPQHNHQQQQQQQQPEDEAENLSMKKEPKRSHSPAISDHQQHREVKSESEAASSPRESPLAGSQGSLHPDAPFSDLPAAGLTAMSALALTPPPHHPSSEYLTSLGQFAAQWLPPNHQNHLPPRHPRDDSPHPGSGQKPSGAAGFPYGHSPSESPLAARSAFPMDGITGPLGAGLFPHGGPLDLHDSFKPESFHGLFVGASLGHHGPGKKPKKHRGDGLARRWSDHSRGLPVCRPKGQHSAPRGGPPRSWTNADLTEALTMVWNKKMTTSQASRVYGIPYNSLLMYVRGKYGKSLKLEQLRRDCTAGEVMNSLNNNVKPPMEPPRVGGGNGGLPPPPPNCPDGTPEVPSSFAHHPLLTGGFFPDFANFPVPVNMVHLLPPSEQTNGPQQPPPPPPTTTTTTEQQLMQQQQQQQQPMQLSAKSRSPSPMPVQAPPPPVAPPAMLQQNGAD